MEIIIASIGGACTLISSLGSIYLDRKYNRENEDISGDNIKFHNIISNINFWIKSEIPNTDYTHEYIQDFLILRLKLIKKNIKKFLNLDFKNMEYDYIVIKLSDMINGMNEYHDLQDVKNYPNISKIFIKNFNKWDNRSDLILMYYLKSIKFTTSNQLIYNFLNVYAASLNSMINSLLSNLDILIPNENINKNILIRNRYKKLFTDFDNKTNINEMIKNILHSQHNDKFLFRFDERGIITYCSLHITNILGYNLENLIGSHILSLIHSDDIEKIKKFLENENNEKLNIQIRSKFDKYFNAEIHRYHAELNMCILS